MAIHVDITDVLCARKRIAPLVRHTPLEYSFSLSQRCGADVFVKWENQQLCKAFKIRGALNKMLCLSEEEKKRGVVTASSGNHAQAIAYAAKMLHVHAEICVPLACPETKKNMVRARGGEWVQLHVVGSTFEETEQASFQLQREKGLTYVSAFEDRLIAAGQGTLALEMLMDEPELDVLICPVSGGGLIGGVAAAARALRPSIEIWGAFASCNTSWEVAWREGAVCLDAPEEDSLADALGGAASPDMFAGVREHLTGVLGVTEAQIKESIALLHKEEHQIVEGGAAVSVAALLSGKIDVANKRVGVVISGGNIDETRLMAILGE